MNNTAKTWWEIRFAMEANPAIVCVSRLEAEDEAAARRAAAHRLPYGLSVAGVRPVDGDFPPVDLTDALRI